MSFPKILVTTVIGFTLVLRGGSSATAGNSPTQSIEDFCISGTEGACHTRAMDAFYSSLEKVAKGEKGAFSRVVHFGDSIISADFVSGTMRQKLQAEFGDGGPGFVLITPAGFYTTANVSFSSKGFSADKLPETRAKDGLLGFGALFSAKSSGAKAKLSTKTPFSRYELYYLEAPQGTDLTLTLDKGTPETVSTKGDTTRPSWRSFTTADGNHELSIEGRGNLKLFGVVLERESGVVYDNLGFVGASAVHLLSIDEAHFSEQLSHRNPNLVVLSYGINESGYLTASSLESYREKLESLLVRVRKAAPWASCLLVSPTDSGEETEDKDGATKTRSKAIMSKLVETQRSAAKSQGCAFFDVYSALGGKNSALSLSSKGILNSDLAHPTPKGAKMIGQMLYEAVMAGYKARR